MKIASLLLAMVVVAGSSTAGPSDVKRLDGTSITPDQIDAIVARLAKAAEVPGVAIAIFDKGKLAYLKAYGLRDKEKGLPLSVDSVMSGASFSKAIFAYMVMKLVDKGVLDLDKPVFQYLPKPLPEYPNYQDLAGDSGYKKITARMLLSHTAGFANWRVLEDDHKLRIHFEPGTRYAYSGEGIDLLQLVVETKTKMPLEDLMQEYVFRPLGMARSSMVWQQRFESDSAKGYDEYGRSLGVQRRSVAEAAGSLSTTIGDFARFVQAVMLREGLGKKSAEQIFNPQIQIVSKHEFPTLDTETSEENRKIRLSYGLGWGLYRTPWGPAFFKEGHDESWRNYTVVFDRKKSGIVIMTNSGNGEGIYKDLLENLLRNTFTPIEWEGFTPYDRLPPRPPLKAHKKAQIDAAVLAKYAGRYGQPPQLILTVRMDGDHLSVRKNDEQEFELFAENQRDFFSEVGDGVWTFELDSAGRASKLTLHVGGGEISVNRID